ncbi:DDE-type integrase/transposase/recombinase [Bacillus pacificus]|uniref:Transposase n=1 Tax=Bacillus luti TaxID=2026191 RepID=A0A7V7SAI4_9BACI|nr:MULTISPECIES: Mu transposase C-terminal domain-containing protein [Bacillus cereus group]KAB2444719.1 transposase [Bacillus luti]MBD0728246.1 transposase [Bacillus cereus]MCC2485844.1 DDE-type integrase/transposase/recombinase [Bacillus pacificus]MCU4738976.1 DDE-type integrase/transposase/recombinase [Bacillus paranthracis]MCU4869122.1 DDE-type integrase/transposase/recombinase [Bacillus paranthracis]
MKKIYIAIGTSFLLNGRRFEITEELEGDVFLAKDLSFEGVTEKFKLNDLLKQLEVGNLIFAVREKKQSKTNQSKVADFSMLPAELQVEAKFRYEAIKPLIDLNVQKIGKYVDARKNELEAEGKKVSRTSLYRWMKMYKESDEDIRSLVSGFNNCGPKGTQLLAEVEAIIDMIINSYYLKREIVPVKVISKLVNNEINVRNAEKECEDKLKEPSLSTIRRRVLARNAYEVETKTKGISAARNKHKSVQLQEKPKYPLQRVECDHTLLDLIVLDDESLLPIGRPTITSLLDVYTGYPLGIYIGFEPPSYTAVMQALLHAVSPKTYVKEKYSSVVNEWYAYGLPELLVVDNGKEFLSNHLADACLQLGIEIYHCPSRKPWYKGAIERHFRTINQQLLHQLPGTTFSNTVVKGDYDSKKHASIRFNVFLEIFHKWLLDEYINEFHKGVKGVPSKLWKRAFESRPRPAVPSEQLEWKIALMKLGYGSIQKTGIQRSYLMYQSSELRGILQRLRVKSKPNRVKFKYDPSDLSKIYVYDEFEDKYYEALCTDQSYSKDLNEYAHKIILKKTKQEEEQVDKKTLAATKAEIMKMIKEEKDFSIRERKQAKRIEGKGSDKEFKGEENKEVEEIVTEIETADNSNVDVNKVDGESANTGQNIMDKELDIKDESGWSYEYVD